MKVTFKSCGLDLNFFFLISIPVNFTELLCLPMGNKDKRRVERHSVSIFCTLRYA